MIRNRRFLAELRVANSLFTPKRGPCERKTLRVVGSKDSGCSGRVGGTKLRALLFSLSVFLKHLIKREVFHYIYFYTIKNRIGFKPYPS